MLVAVIVLAVVLLACLAALAWLLLRTPEWLGTRWQRLDPTAADTLDGTPRPPSVAGTTRRLISIEILNAGELAGSRGRLAGLAHAVVPGLTRRVVYDQTLKILRAQLAEHRVDADVRVHVLRPQAGTSPALDEVTTIDLDQPGVAPT